MSLLDGSCLERFDPVRTAALRALDEDELGLSVAVALDGELVVDLWGGWADTARTRPWTADTIVNTWSTTKTMTALAALVLVERGELDLHAPVGRYWPAFAANGKDRVRVRHLLDHTSGVSGLEPPATATDLYDHAAVADRLAAQPPWWEPGTASGYHSAVYGHLVGEVVRRVTGRSLGAFFAEHVAGPLGADFHIGLGPAQLGRVSDVVPPPPPRQAVAHDPASIPGKTLFTSRAGAAIANTEAWRRAEIGAANGHGNARGVALAQAALTGGGLVGGAPLLSEATIGAALTEHVSGIDLVLGMPMRFTAGYALPHPDSVGFLPAGRVAAWGGWGGSLVVNDLDRRMTFAYVMNSMHGVVLGSRHSIAALRAAYASLRHA